MTPMIIQGYTVFWQLIYHHQALLGGIFALIAAAFTTAFLWRQSRAVAEEGKRERDFTMKQHEIEAENKRYAAAVMLEAEIRSGTEAAHLDSLVDVAKEHAHEYECLYNGETGTRLIFPPVYTSFLNNYSHYIKNMPLMRLETVQEVSRFYIYAANLSKMIELSNAQMEEKQENKTRANLLARVSNTAATASEQFYKTMPLLAEEVLETQEELEHLKNIIKRLAQVLHRPSKRELRRLLKMSTRGKHIKIPQDEGGGKQTP